jgi:hypothetical protein
MKKILFIALLLGFYNLVQATTLATYAGPTESASFSNTVVPVKTFNSITQASGINLVQYDAQNVTHGWSGSGLNYLRIEVRKSIPNTLYSSTYVSIQTGGSANISVPSNEPYIITFYVTNGQLYNASNYTGLRLSNVTISN